MALNYDEKRYFFKFEEESIKKRNDWEYKISTIRDNVPGFEFERIEKMAYAAGPGSYTGARLAFTFLDTLNLIINKKFYAFSNLAALQHNHPNKVAIMKGSKNDYFYRHNDIDYYCETLDQIPQHTAYVVLRNDQLKLDNMIELNCEVISKNILDLVMGSENKALSSNYPNYIKELNYVKSR